MRWIMKDLFINRKRELQTLISGLKNGDDFILVAPRRFGKTALAVRALEELAKNEHFIIIDIDLMKYSGGTVKNLAEAIIEKVLNSIGIRGKLRRIWNDLDFTFNLKIKFQDLEIEPLIKLAKEGTDEWALLEDSLELAEKIAKQTKRDLIVFYDEFGELYSLGERVIKMFRSVIQRHKHVSYLFAGSQETVMNKIFLDKSGAFYRFGELIYLKNLNKEDVYNYILETYPGTNQKLSLKNNLTLLDSILTELEGHPYYTSQVISYLERNKDATLEDYYDFLSHELFNREEAYLSLQAAKIKTKPNALEAIRIIALNMNPYQELKMRSQHVYAILQFLLEGGFIWRENVGKYVITDPLLKRYLADY